MTIHVTLKQLEVFSAVIQESSYTHAAKSLNMTQPAVSTQIKNLEEQLDIKLFEYVGKKLSLTHAGHDIFKKIYEVQNKVAELKNFVANIKGLSTGSLNIAIPQGAQKNIFHIIKAFYAKYPHINIDIKVIRPRSQLQLLENDDVDFSIAQHAPKKSSCCSDVLFTYNSYLIAPNDHPLAKKRKISPIKIAHETFIIDKHRSNSQKILEDKVLTKQSKLIHVDNIDSMKYAVAAGLGLAVTAGSALDPELNKKCYAILDIEGFPIQSRMYLIHRHKKLLSPLGIEFKKFAHTYCKKNFAI